HRVALRAVVNAADGAEMLRLTGFVRALRPGGVVTTPDTAGGPPVTTVVDAVVGETGQDFLGRLFHEDRRRADDFGGGEVVARCSFGHRSALPAMSTLTPW